MARQLGEHHEDDPRRGEGRDASGAGEVVDAELDDVESETTGLRQELGVDERAVAPQVDGVEHTAADELEREVDVADPQTQTPADEVVVDERVHRSNELPPPVRSRR